MQDIINLAVNQVTCKQLPTMSIYRATNLYGSDETRGFVNTTGRPGIIYESQLPKGMASIERIREMESGWQRAPGMQLVFARIYVIKSDKSNFMKYT